MANPKVSVLMSVYNSERYLREAIDSILNQTLEDFEFIIIDDGSTDASNQIIKSYPDPRLKLVKNEKNIGLTKSLNMGINLCRGEYIARMDADDIRLPKRLKIQFNFMDSNPEVGMCGTLNKGLDNNKVGVSKYPEDHDSICCMLLFQNVFDHSTLMMSKKKLFEYRLKYDDSIKYAQDYELISRAARFFPLTNIQQVLVFSRTHPDQIANRYHKSQKSVTRLVQERQLNELGINPGENYLDLHGNTVTLRLPPSKKMILDTANWLKIIKSANETDNHRP